MYTTTSFQNIEFVPQGNKPRKNFELFEGTQKKLKLKVPWTPDFKLYNDCGCYVTSPPPICLPYYVLCQCFHCFLSVFIVEFICGELVDRIRELRDILLLTPGTSRFPSHC